MKRHTHRGSRSWKRATLRGGGQPGRSPGLGRRAPVLSLALIAATVLPAFSADPAPSKRQPVYVRELYVPYEEFVKRAKADPGGIVMNLTEYRALVTKGLVRAREQAPVELPPVAAVVTQATHRGELADLTARFRSTLVVRTAQEGWVRCELGQLPPALGSVSVDGKPGWILRGAQAKPGTEKGQKQQAAKKGARRPPSYLLLWSETNDVEEHQVEITFSLQASKSDERWKLSGPLPRAATAKLTLEVPGRAEAQSVPPFVEAVPAADGEATALHLALGPSARFSIEWNEKRAAGASAALLTADHRVTLLPRRGDPVFTWETTVTIRRQKVAELELQEGAGAEVVRVSGDHVHSWERSAKSLRILLNEPLLGDVKVRFEGFLTPESLPEEVQAFDVAAPTLSGAYSQSGYLAVCDPTPARLEIGELNGVAEVALGEAQVPALGPARVTRLFSFTSGAARVLFQTRPRPAAFSYRATCLARLLEGRVTFDGLYGIRVRHGRLYRLRFSLAAPWRLASLAAVPAGSQGARELRFTTEGAGDDRRVEVTLTRALEAGEPLDLHVRLERTDWVEDLSWDRRQPELRVPTLDQAERSRVDLGIAVAGSMVVETIERGDWERVDPGALVPEPEREGEPRTTPVTWKTLDAQRLREVGLELPELIAGLSSTRPAEPITLTLRHARTRGEYHAVMHLLALERQVRVRTDILLTVTGSPLASVSLRVPVATDRVVHVLGEGVKERIDVRELESGSVRTVSFEEPWIGSRQLRLEYELEHSPETDVPVPTLDLLGPDANAQTWSGEKGIVFQSLGPVELEVKPGESLVAATFEELPELGEPWKRGRLLFAYRFQGDGDVGTFRTREHPPSRVLAAIAREMDITTLLGASGVSRTRVEVFLAYTDKEHLEVVLPAESRLLATEIDGEPVRTVWRGESPGQWSVPLPPRSHARLALVYEYPDTTSGSEEELGSWGTWREVGPHFPGVPVGTCRWRLYHPGDYRFFIDEGSSNLVPLAPEDRPATFAASFFGRLLAGKWPIFTAFRSEERRQPLHGPALPAGTVVARGPGPQPGRTASQILTSRDQQKTQLDERLDGWSPGVRLVPEGVLIEASKMGGTPRLALDYRSYQWWNFAKKAMFVVTLLGALSIALAGGRRAFYPFVAWGLFVATLLPLGLNWESPFLLIPFCEGLVAALLVAAAGELVRVVVGITSRMLARRRLGTAAATARATLLLLSALLLAATVRGPALGAEDKAQDESVLIPYDPADLSSLDSPQQKVYLPAKKFRELWLLAHPEARPIPGPPTQLALGDVSYQLGLEADGVTCRISGDVAFRVLTEEWVTLALPFKEAQLVRVTLDGEEVGFTTRDGVPLVAVQGLGAHRLGVVLSGAVEEEPGTFSIRTALLCGPGTHLEAELPAGARPQVRGVPAGAWVRTEEGKPTFVSIDLGTTSRLDLNWTFPKIAGEIASRLESISYSLFSLVPGGYRVERVEKVHAAGTPVDALEYRLLGDWEIAEVSAPDLVEWGVTLQGDERRLNLYFSQSRSRIDAQIHGVARHGDGPTQAATLLLSDGVRQETFAGLRHGTRERWRPDAFAGARRVSSQELSKEFPSTSSAPERIYHVYGGGEGSTLAAEPREGSVTLATDCVAIVGTQRAMLVARSRYKVTAPGPLRQEVKLPEGWTPRVADGDNLLSWEARPGDDGTTLVFHFDGRATTGTQVTWSAELSYATPPRPLSLPPVETSVIGQALQSETLRLAIAAATDLEISVAEVDGLAALPLEGTRNWVSLPSSYSYRFAFRSVGPRPSFTLSLEPITPTPRLRATTVLFARAREDSILVNARLLYQLEQGTMESFGIRLPAGADLVALETRNQQSREENVTAAGPEIQVRLVSPEFREQVVDLVYLLPRSVDEAPVPITAPVPLHQGEAISQVDEYVGLVQGQRVRITATNVANLVPLPAEELPFLPKGLTPESLRPTFRATRQPWSLDLEQESIGAVDELAALVELAELVTVLGSDGTLRTEVTYLLRNRNLQFLKVELPADANLWGLTVDGWPVLASGDEELATNAEGRRLLRVPLERVGPGDPDLKIVIIYEEPRVSMPSLYGSFALSAPRLPETRVFETLWHLELPPGYSVDVDGNMQEITASFRHSRKVDNVLQQISVLNTTVEESQSERLRAQARANLKRLEQALSDNVQDLEQTLQQTPAAEIPQAERERQLAAGRKSLELGYKVREDLRKTRARGEEDEAESQVGREFRDGLRFLQNEWRPGTKAPTSSGEDRDRLDGGAGNRRGAPSAGAGAEPREGGTDVADMDGLLGTQPSPGLPPKLSAVDPFGKLVEPRPVEGRGLPPLDDASAAPLLPGLLTPPAREDQRQSLTFRHLGPSPELDLSLSPAGVWLRYGALAILVALPAALWWWRRRRAA